jgi:uroporphyrinogen III methyltransferase / synthase
VSALAGKKVVITRAVGQSAELVTLLTSCSATPLLYPCIETVLPEDTQSLDNALFAASNGEFDWLVLTSANTVSFLSQRLKALNVQLKIPVAVVGPVTAEAAEKWLGLYAEVMPEHYVAEALGKALVLSNKRRILLPQSAIAEDTLSSTLISHGFDVTVVTAYQTVMGTGGVDLPRLLETGKIDAITFTSGSTVRNLLKRFALEGGNRDLLTNLCVVCIGAKTAQVAQECGLYVNVMPQEHTLAAMVDAMEKYFLEKVLSS